jgi:hypothetical protein
MPRRSRGGAEVQLYSYFNLGAKAGWVVNATPRPLYPRETPGTYRMGGWVGPRAGVDGCGKFHSLPPGLDPRPVQVVVSRYTDWAIPAHVLDDKQMQKEIFYR